MTVFEISTVEFVKNKFLTHPVNFGIGSAFSKGLASAFSQGPGPDPRYKVCRVITSITGVLSLRAALF